MIRLIIIAIAIFLIWVLFFSSFEKRQKIAIAIVAILICAVGALWERHTKKPRSNLVSVTQLVSCGVQAKHSYRSNFDLDICLNNIGTVGSVKRVDMEIKAIQCAGDNAADRDCIVLESVARSLSVDIAPQTTEILKENLSFKLVDKDASGLQWGIEVTAVKAI